MRKLFVFAVFALAGCSKPDEPPVLDIKLLPIDQDGQAGASPVPDVTPTPVPEQAQCSPSNRTDLGYQGFPYAGTLQMTRPDDMWKPIDARPCGFVPNQFRPVTFEKESIGTTVEARHLPQVAGSGEPPQTPIQVALAFRKHLLQMSKPWAKGHPPCNNVIRANGVASFTCSDEAGLSIFAYLVVAGAPDNVMVETDITKTDADSIRQGAQAHTLFLNSLSATKN